jgi:hypothetical protein
MTLLHYFGDFLRELLAAVPLGWVRVAFVALPMAVLAWVVALPKAHTRPQRDQTHWAEDLKIWAVLALLVQIAIYACL